MKASKFTIIGKPIPKARPRAGAGGHFYSPSSASEGQVAKMLMTARGRYTGTDVGVTILFYGADSRSDLDNLGKFYLDALVKAGVIKDDRYVKMLYLERREGGEPRTEMTVAEWNPSDLGAMI